MVYAHDGGAGAKHDKAIELLTRLFEDGVGCLSLQVLAEFHWAATRKLGMKSEDFADGRRFGTVTIRNPFR